MNVYVDKTGEKEAIGVLDSAGSFNGRDDPRFGVKGHDRTPNSVGEYDQAVYRNCSHVLQRTMINWFYHYISGGPDKKPALVHWVYSNGSDTH
jgi:hypothetical protein